MEHVVYFVVAVAIAAALLGLASAYFGLFNADAPLDAAYALAYVSVKPVNSSAVWVGVTPAYSDVYVERVLINGADYAVGVKAPLGRTAWLNASGMPLVARCGQRVDVVTAHGTAKRALSFVVQCPKAAPRVELGAVIDVEMLRKYAFALLRWYGTMDVPKIAVRVDPVTGGIIIKNVADIPLLVVANLEPGKYMLDWGIPQKYQVKYVFPDLVVYGNKMYLLAPGEEVVIESWLKYLTPEQARGQGLKWTPHTDFTFFRYTLYADVKYVNGTITGWINGELIEVKPKSYKICTYAEFRSGRQEYCKKWENITGYVPNYDVLYRVVPPQDPICQWRPWLLGCDEPKVVFEGTHPYVLKVENGTLYVGYGVYRVWRERCCDDYWVLREAIEIKWSPAPWRGSSAYAVRRFYSGANLQFTHMLYVYPADYVLANSSAVGLASLSPVRVFQVEAVGLGNGTYVVQWADTYNATDVKTVSLPPGRGAYVLQRLNSPLGFAAVPTNITSAPFVAFSSGISLDTFWSPKERKDVRDYVIYFAVPPGVRVDADLREEVDMINGIWRVFLAPGYGANLTTPDKHVIRMTASRRGEWHVDVKVYVDGREAAVLTYDVTKGLVSCRGCVYGVPVYVRAANSGRYNNTIYMVKPTGGGPTLVRYDPGYVCVRNQTSNNPTANVWTPSGTADVWTPSGGPPSGNPPGIICKPTGREPGWYAASAPFVNVSSAGRLAVPTLYVSTDRGAQVYKLDVSLGFGDVRYPYDLTSWFTLYGFSDYLFHYGYVYALLSLYYDEKWLPTSFGLSEFYTPICVPLDNDVEAPGAPDCPHMAKSERITDAGPHNVQKTSDGYIVPSAAQVEKTYADCHGNTYKTTQIWQTAVYKTKNGVTSHQDTTGSLCLGSDAKPDQNGFLRCP